MLSRLLVFAVLGVVVNGLGCAARVGTSTGTTMIKRGQPSLKEMTVACPRAQVFDYTLAFAQARNLEVKVLEKSSGLIRFERSALSAADLDQFCIFPIVDTGTGEPVGTFEDWDREYLGFSEGTVNLNFLLSETGARSTNVSVRGNWSVSMNSYTGPVSSNGTLEDELLDHLAGQQGCSLPAKPTTDEKVEQLRRLRDKGLITAAEYHQKVRELPSE